MGKTIGKVKPVKVPTGEKKKGLLGGEKEVLVKKNGNKLEGLIVRLTVACCQKTCK